MHCPFCYELATDIIPEEFEIDLPSRSIAESDHFAVISDISPLSPGHVLVIPKAHLLNFGSVNEEQRGELTQLLTRVKEVISHCYDTPVIMEHGSSTCSDGGGCISHAHLQVFPARVEMLQPLSRFRVEHITSFWDLRRWSDRDEPYVFFQDRDEDMYIADEINGIEKQFIRIQIARSIGLPDPQWDWRKRIFLENLYETVRILKQAWRQTS
jgi:diadenosine tetraphosphate (Ap4A) HIT family hydrolase